MADLEIYVNGIAVKQVQGANAAEVNKGDASAKMPSMPLPTIILGFWQNDRLFFAAFFLKFPELGQKSIVNATF